MNKQELYETIERYLEGQLEGKALVQFEQQLKKDPSLQTELVLHRKIHQELGDTKKQQLVRLIQEISKDYRKDSRIIPIYRMRSLQLAASVILAVGLALAWYFFLRPDAGAPPIVEEQPSIERSDEVPPEAQVAEDQPKEEIRKEQKEEEAPVVQPPQEMEEDMLAFAANKELEDLPVGHPTIANFAFVLDSPAESLSLDEGEAKLFFKGKVQTAQIPDDRNFKLQILDNRSSGILYEASLPIEFPEEDEIISFAVQSFPFQLSVSLKLLPGLYYYKILTQDQAVYVGKVSLKE